MVHFTKAIQLKLIVVILAPLTFRIAAKTLVAFFLLDHYTSLAGSCLGLTVLECVARFKSLVQAQSELRLSAFATVTTITTTGGLDKGDGTSDTLNTLPVSA